MNIADTFGRKPRRDPALPMPSNIPAPPMAADPPTDEEAAQALTFVTGLSKKLARLNVDLQKSYDETEKLRVESGTTIERLNNEMHMRTRELQRDIEAKNARIKDLERQLADARYESESNRRYGCTVQAHIQTAMDALMRAHNAGIDAVGKPGEQPLPLEQAEQIIAETAAAIDAVSIGKTFGANSRRDADRVLEPQHG